MAKLISTKSIGNVREIRRSWRINIESKTNTPIAITAHRETILCDDENNIVQRTDSGTVERRIPGSEAETIELPNGITLTGAQVAQAVEAFVEKWDTEDVADAAVFAAALAAARAAQSPQG